MVLVEEVTDGGWGIADHVLTLAQLQGGTDTDDADEPATPPGDQQ